MLNFILIRVVVVSFVCVQVFANEKIKIFITDHPIIQFGGKMYKKELITDKFYSPNELDYDKFSRNLFFTYMDENIQNSGRAIINVVTKKTHKIKGIQNNKAVAVDPDTGEVYFGNERGLYKYDRNKHEATNIALFNVNVYKLVIRHNEMYLIDANNHMLYKVFDEGNIIVKVGDWKTIMNFEIDNDKNIHFVNMCGVFCAVKGHEAVNNKDISVAYHFIINDNEVLAVTDDGIYEVNCVNGTAIRTGSISFIPHSITTGDNGEMFYSLDDGIFRLKPINSYFIYNIRRKSQKPLK